MKDVDAIKIVGDSEEVMELSIRRSGLQSEAPEKSGAATMKRSPAGVAAAQADAAMTGRPMMDAIEAMTRLWAKTNPDAVDACELLDRVTRAMLSPREKARRVDAEILRRVG